MKAIGLLGATSLVGTSILSQLENTTVQVFAFSRSNVADKIHSKHIQWQSLKSLNSKHKKPTISHWICVAPIWVLPDYFPLLESYGAKRIIALSSTSLLTKQQSPDAIELKTVTRLMQGEQLLQSWAKTQQIEWLILRPTLIYGFGKDKNIAEIARIIKRFHFFPLFGLGTGLRQPIHADNVAHACLAALNSPSINHTYTVSGGTTLTYRDMVTHIFNTLGKRPFFVIIPLRLFKIAIFCLRLFPRYRNWSSAMAERMNQDLVFEHQAAQKDFGFTAKPFLLTYQDVDKK